MGGYAKKHTGQQPPELPAGKERHAYSLNSAATITLVDSGH